MKLAFAVLLASAGVAWCAPASTADALPVPRSAVEPTLIGSALAETQKRQGELEDVDPDICYGDCILAGGADWPCICECIGDPDCR